MIARYTRPEMGKIWTEENKFQKWLDVELAVCEAYAETEKIPSSAWMNIREKARFNVDRILEIEAETNHDVIAFLTNVAEYVGPDSRYIHYGMTSSDVLDTAFALQIVESGNLLLADIQSVLSVLKRRALEFKNTPCIGRTHGVHSEPITFGLKLAIWYSEFKRHEKRLVNALEDIRVGKISGAVGTFAYIDPLIEEKACAKLGLKPDEISNQIIQRDRHAHFMTTIALIASTLEKVAIEIRALQKTEVLEVEEYFAKGQKGSSAMPHKRNPITCERISGLARLLRGNALAALENVPLWHERDISHSSVERVIFPDSCIVLDYILTKTKDVIDRLLVYPDTMLNNLEKTNGLVFSQALLLKLIEKEVSREEAYRIVQSLAHSIWNKNNVAFKQVVLESEEIHSYISKDEIDTCFDLQNNLRHVNTIFERIGLN
ncbi:adenylosuccinate lyase [candidate division KSB1 bacterium]|nr:adenylosuccinate lyase [candidate division KSB1 bacterium]